MMMLDEIVGSAAVTSIILAILAAEALFYILYFKRLRSMLPTLAAGACLVLALRGALLHHTTTEVAAFLALGFVFHVMEVRAWLKMSKHQPQ